MNRNLEIRLPKVDGGHPIPLSARQKNRVDGLHAEVRHVHDAIEERQVATTPRSSKPQTGGYKSREMEEEQAPQHPWQSKPE